MKRLFKVNFRQFAHCLLQYRLGTYFSTPLIAAFYAWAAQSDFYFQFWTRVNWAHLWGFEPIKVQTAYCFSSRIFKNV